MVTQSRNLRHAFSLLPKSSFRKLILLCVFQLSVAFFDIVAILLLGVISKSGFEYVQSGSSKFPLVLVRIFSMERLDFEAQFSLLSATVFILFGARTTISIWGNRKILTFLGGQGATASNSLLDKVLLSDPNYVVRKNSQEFLYGLTSGIDNLILNYLGSLTLLVTETFFLAAVLIVVLVVQPLTGICALLIFGGAFYLIQRATSGKGRELARELGDLSVSYSQELLETLQIYLELVLRRSVFSTTESVRRKRGQSMLLRAQLLFLPTFSKFLFEFVLIFGGVTVGIAQLLVSDVTAAISSLVMFLAAASRILPSLIRAQGALLAVKQSEGASEMPIKQLSELERIAKIDSKFIIQRSVESRFIPEISISNLEFSYETSPSFSLHEISLDIRAGNFVAIVGESGAGKTTLVDLILGMNNPVAGSVRISGLNPLEAAIKWPGKIAYVPQNILVIDGSIRKNISLSSEGQGNEEKLLLALAKANLLSDVQNLPGKLDEVVGERGMKLSGGQRQRLGIARALYTNPDLIVFDEATSALDSLTEKTVTEAIFKNNERGVTLIVIAHRLSTVKNADVVVLLEHGRIVASGTFDEVRQIAPKFDEQAKLANL